ncbi:MAG TPA: HNH endonuclease, partial [Dermatophilaceae bacterium]|nr:HNH endonuclease [Dermatophilaceae bacterium]
RVTIRPIPDTMAVVSAVLPVAQAVAVHAALMCAAAQAKASGDPRSQGQVMADTLTERVTGQVAAADVQVEVQLVMTDRALLHGEETPAHVPGYGPVPAGCARDLLVGTRPKMWLRRLFTHPTTGMLVAMESKRRLFPPGLRRYLVARDGVCRTPWCDAPIRHADHVEPWAGGGSTTDSNGEGLCVTCNLAKEHPGWRHSVFEPPSPQTTESHDPHTVLITTPTGHTYTSVAPPVLLGVVELPRHPRVHGHPSPLETELSTRLAS